MTPETPPIKLALALLVRFPPALWPFLARAREKYLEFLTPPILLFLTPTRRPLSVHILPLYATFLSTNSSLEIPISRSLFIRSLTNPRAKSYFLSISHNSYSLFIKSRRSFPSFGGVHHRLQKTKRVSPSPVHSYWMSLGTLSLKLQLELYSLTASWRRMFNQSIADTLFLCVFLTHVWLSSLSLS